jgi:outer membrane protein
MRGKLVGYVLFFVLVCVTLSFASNKIGVFDMQIVMVKSTAGMDIKNDLNKKKEYYTAEIKKRENALKQMRDDLQKKSMMLSQEAKDAKEKDYQKKLRDLKLYANDSEAELKTIYREKTQKLVHDILYVARDFAKKNNFSIVIEKQEGGVVYNDKSIDITDEILKAFNEYYLKNKK